MRGERQPASIIGGTRRSTRTSKPSARLQAADNACDPSSSSSMRMRKRALSSAEDLPVKRVAMRVSVPPDSEDDIEDSEMPPVLDVDNSSADEFTNPMDDDEDDNDAEEAYLRTKALGDADHQVGHFHHDSTYLIRSNLHCKARRTTRKTDRTADLRTIYTEELGRINKDTGIPEDGWWCNICRYVELDVVLFSLSVYTHTLLTRDAGLPARQSFLRGNISTRRTHISQ
jgi:hypothetical protein